MTEAEQAEIQAEAMVVADQLMTALNTLDPEVAAALYDRSKMHGNDGAVYFATYDEWVAHNEEFFGRFEELEGGWTNTRVDVLAPDAALFVGQNEMAVTQVSGARTNIQGYITLVMKKTDGAWKVIHQASTGRWTPIEEG
jgi:uncharacterized protein (TIGR02246 family)